MEPLFPVAAPWLISPEVPVALLNCAAPAVVHTSHIQAAMHLTQYVMSDSQKAIGLALTPVFSYTKNGVWKEEGAIMQYLASTGAHCDRQWFLTFKEKCAPTSAIITAASYEVGHEK